MGPRGRNDARHDGGGGQQNLDAVYYIQTESVQYKIMPFQISVLLDQNLSPGVSRRPRKLADGDPGLRVRPGQAGDPSRQAGEGNEMMWGGDMYGSGMMPG